jgi:phage-related protein
MANDVTLTFAGDTAQLEAAFDRVGTAANGVDRSVRDAGDGFDRASEAADTAEGRFQGTASSISGTADAAQGFAAIAKGNLFEGSVLAAGGLADLAEGFNYTIIPLAKTTAGFVAQKAAMLGHAVASTASTVATKAMAAGQWLLNAAMAANPIGLVVIAIVALIAIFILAYKNSETFRRIVHAAFDGIKVAALALWTGIKTYFTFVINMWKTVIGVAVSLVGKIRGGFNTLVSAAKTVGAAITAPFRAAFNAIRNLWNNTLGGKGFSIPGWVPGIGGNEFRIPRFHTGGTASGAMGGEFLALLRAGERVVPGGGSGGAMTVAVVAGTGGSSADRALAELILGLIRRGVIKLVALDNGRVAVA